MNYSVDYFVSTGITVAMSAETLALALQVFVLGLCVSCDIAGLIMLFDRADSLSLSGPTV